MEDTQELVVKEEIVLSKFNGDPLPENEFERIHILNGELVRVEQIENGMVVSTKTIKEV